MHTAQRGSVFAIGIDWLGARLPARFLGMALSLLVGCLRKEEGWKLPA